MVPSPWVRQWVGTSAGSAKKRALSARVVGARSRGEPLDAGARGQGRPGFVEAEVAVRPDPEDLHVDAAGIDDLLFVVVGPPREPCCGSGGFRGPVGDVESVRGQPDDGADLAFQDAAVGLRMVDRQADVLIERKPLRGAEPCLRAFDGPPEFRVQPQGRGAGGQAQHGWPAAAAPIRSHAGKAGQDGGSRAPGGLGGRRADQDLHACTSHDGCGGVRQARRVWGPTVRLMPELPTAAVAWASARAGAWRHPVRQRASRQAPARSGTPNAVRPRTRRPGRVVRLPGARQC